jgi:hypothetical protein
MMRLVVVDWLLRVVLRVRIHRSTFANSVHLVDLLLTKIPVTKDDIQLVAAVCLWISTKIGETVGASLQKFTAICQGLFTPDAFREKELEVVALLDCRLDFPTAQIYILPFLTEIDHLDVEGRVQFWVDLSFYEYEFVEVSPPQIVIAAICGVLGEGCPFRRLCAVAQVEPSVGVTLELMKKLVAMARALEAREATGIEAAYSDAEVRDSIQAMSHGIGYFSQYPE